MFPSRLDWEHSSWGCVGGRYYGGAQRPAAQPNPYSTQGSQAEIHFIPMGLCREYPDELFPLETSCLLFRFTETACQRLASFSYCFALLPEVPLLLATADTAAFTGKLWPL